MPKTNGQQFFDDERVQEAKRLLQEALVDHQKQLQGPKMASGELKSHYQRLLDQMGDLRGRPLYFPYLSSGIGKGALVELLDGSVKYDFITGIGVHVMGHSHSKLLESSIDAALEDTLMQGNLQTSPIALKVMEQFHQMANQYGADLDHVFLTSSGAMANENAFKIIFNNQHPRARLLAFERCFSGRSLATAQMTFKPEYRIGVPKVLDIDYVPFFDRTDPQGSTEHTLTTLRNYFEKYPDQYAAMTLELVQGEGGYYPGEHDFFMAIIQELKAHHVLVMIDEIQTFGRTSKYFAFQHFQLDEHVDIVSVGKMTQVCATLYRKSLNPQPGILSQTFTSSSQALHGAHVILGELMNGNYCGEQGRIMQYANHFMGRLKQLSEKYASCIGGPFGLGAMVGMTVFDGSLEKSKAFLSNLYDLGVLGFIAGKSPVRVRFLMPYMAITIEDIDNVIAIIEQAVLLTQKEI